MGIGAPWDAVDFCVFDLETTGLDPERGAEPIEVGGVRIVRGDITGRFQSFVSPEGRIPGTIQELTGIEPSDVRGAPTASSVLGDFLDFAEDAVLVAHNIDFDRGFLDVYAPRPVRNEGIDTLAMARVLLEQQDHSLDHLVRQFGLDREKGHRALDDARATAELFRRLAVRIRNYEDYRRCGIPRRVMREDLELILPILDGPDQLSGDYGSTGALLRLDTSELTISLDMKTGEARDLIDGIESIYEDPEVSLQPPVHWSNSFKIRYWKTSNYLVNGSGALLLLGAMTATDSNRFYALMLTAVPFFVVSPVITYIREKYANRLPRILGMAGCFLAWFIVLLVVDVLDVVLREWRSILNLGG